MNEYGWDISDYLIPDKYYEDLDNIKWKDFTFSFIPISGHSLCSTGLIINEKTIFVGDTVMMDIHDNVVIPYICTGNIQKGFTSRWIFFF